MSEVSGNTDFKYNIGHYSLKSLACFLWIQKPIGVREGAHERRGSLMKTPAAMQNADGCVAFLFSSRVPASFPLFLVPLSFTFEKHGLSLVVNCLINSLFYRQSYFKKVVEQCVVILAITWLDFKILISTSYFQPGEILIGTDARLQRRFPLKSNRK